MMKIILFVLLALWIGHALFRIWKKSFDRNVNDQKPPLSIQHDREGEKPSVQPTEEAPPAQHFEDARFDWHQKDSAQVLKAFESSGYHFAHFRGASLRPDGQFGAAIFTDEDPDFPELWIVKLSAEPEIIRLDSNSLIDWPGQRLVWPENDFKLYAFDRLVGRSQFDVDLAGKSFLHAPLDYSWDEHVSETWYVTCRIDNEIHWALMRLFSDDTVQTLVPYPASRDLPGTKPFRYNYSIGHENEKRDLLMTHSPVYFNKQGLMLVDRTVGIFSHSSHEAGAKAEQIDHLFASGAIRLPDGADDEAMGPKLMQRLKTT